MLEFGIVGVKLVWIVVEGLHNHIDIHVFDSLFKEQ
jgi:hypothetical protein